MVNVRLFAGLIAGSLVHVLDVKILRDTQFLLSTPSRGVIVNSLGLTSLRQGKPFSPREFPPEKMYCASACASKLNCFVAVML